MLGWGHAGIISSSSHSPCLVPWTISVNLGAAWDRAVKGDSEYSDLRTVHFTAPSLLNWILHRFPSPTKSISWSNSSMFSGHDIDRRFACSSSRFKCSSSHATDVPFHRRVVKTEAGMSTSWIIWPNSAMVFCASNHAQGSQQIIQVERVVGTFACWTVK